MFKVKSGSLSIINKSEISYVISTKNILLLNTFETDIFLENSLFHSLTSFRKFPICVIDKSKLKLINMSIDNYTG